MQEVGANHQLSVLFIYLGSITDIILMKLLRTKQIEDNQGKTLVSEGIDANYQDMINYAVFALIHLDQKK